MRFHGIAASRASDGRPQGNASCSPRRSVATRRGEPSRGRALAHAVHGPADGTCARVELRSLVSRRNAGHGRQPAAYSRDIPGHLGSDGNFSQRLPDADALLAGERARGDGGAVVTLVSLPGLDVASGHIICVHDAARLRDCHRPTPGGRPRRRRPRHGLYLRSLSRLCAAFSRAWRPSSQRSRAIRPRRALARNTHTQGHPGCLRRPNASVAYLLSPGGFSNYSNLAFGCPCRLRVSLERGVHDGRSGSSDVIHSLAPLQPLRGRN